VRAGHGSLGNLPAAYDENDTKVKRPDKNVRRGPTARLSRNRERLPGNQRIYTLGKLAAKGALRVRACANSGGWYRGIRQRTQSESRRDDHCSMPQVLSAFAASTVVKRRGVPTLPHACFCCDGRSGSGNAAETATGFRYSACRRQTAGFRRTVRHSSVLSVTKLGFFAYSRQHFAATPLARSIRNLLWVAVNPIVSLLKPVLGFRGMCFVLAGAAGIATVSGTVYVVRRFVAYFFSSRADRSVMARSWVPDLLMAAACSSFRWPLGWCRILHAALWITGYHSAGLSQGAGPLAPVARSQA